MKSIPLFFLFSLVCTALLAQDPRQHFLELGGSVSTLSLKDSGVGFGPAIGYRFQPLADLPLSVGLTVTGARFDTAAAGKVFSDFFSGSATPTTSANFTFFAFVLEAQYRFFSNATLFLAAGLGYGQAMTIETRRNPAPATPSLGDLITDTNNRDVLQLGFDTGFHLTADANLVLRTQCFLVKERNVFAPALLAQIAL